MGTYRAMAGPTGLCGRAHMSVAGSTWLGQSPWGCGRGHIAVTGPTRLWQGPCVCGKAMGLCRGPRDCNRVCMAVTGQGPCVCNKALGAVAGPMQKQPGPTVCPLGLLPSSHGKTGSSRPPGHRFSTCSEPGEDLVCGPQPGRGYKRLSVLGVEDQHPELLSHGQTPEGVS